MVEGEPPLKHKQDCDVKSEHVPNGCGSKDLELGSLGVQKDIVKAHSDVPKSSDKADFERAIELTKYGKFHYLLLAVCGFVSTSEEMDVISMSFILPSAQCDLHLTTETKGWLNSIIFIGMMAGAYTWGSVADSLGRKRVLIASSFMNAVCIVASSFSQSYELFMLFRFLNGAAGPVIWSYFAEFQPKSKRGSMLSFMAAFWTLGNLFVAGLAMLIIPHDIGIVTPIFTYNSWRIFLLICAFPSFIVAALLCFLPESPKFLLSQGKSEEAIAIFRHIYHINTGKSSDDYPVKHLIYEEEHLTKEEKAKIAKRGKFKNMIFDILDNSKQLFVSPILRNTVISITINFTFHIGYYGLMMWFPELFNRFEEYANIHPGQPASVCQVTDYVIHNGTQVNEERCVKEIPGSVFTDSLITVAAALPSNIIAILGMDRLGRKFFLVFSTISSGICSASMYFVYSKAQNVAVSAVFSGVISCGNAALDCLITEIFPTNLRATGIAISMVAARLGGVIGNIVIATLLDQYCPAPTFIVAGLLIGGGLLSLFLPNTTREPLS
ncbi:hypothetical protein NQ317_013749 [Molorchus minor]|uniref:Major facilitator superfamily (MFS) profile domain-containing protein n=1 Tax=Molorchus minor TaxID=1323400 RepID=A0ABQ9JDW4_9CUCU|nr:hypothetical protein NQ317_013749 [Molorchus minor]